MDTKYQYSKQATDAIKICHRMVAIFMIEENVTVQNYSYSEYAYVF